VTGGLAHVPAAQAYRGSPSPPSGFGAPPCATSHRSVLLDQVHQRHQRPHIGIMPHLDLSDDEAAALIKELRETIDNDRYPFSARIHTLRAILAKLAPQPVQEARFVASGLRTFPELNLGEAHLYTLPRAR
jgi:hypothetical protein